MALAAAADLADARGGAGPPAAATADTAHIGVAFRSERHARLDGEPWISGFDPMSAFMPAADGWVRLHGNYAHHRAALLEGLGLGPVAAADDVRAEVASRPAVDVEDAVVAAGGCAAAVRDEEAWLVHRQGTLLAAAPLVEFEPGDAGAPPLPARPAGEAPAAGLRVLDLTRVIAGPAGTRYLAALGADVLRIDPPWLPEIPEQALDSGPGKRSALLDLGDAEEDAVFETLLGSADVLVHSYRPGGLARFGLEPASLSERHPHLTSVSLSAWGTSGPWGDRRGFDSLVQAATGIALACGEDGTPGTLPAQALDHGTGYLAAAAALRGLAARAREGRPAHAQLALARTALWLLAQPRTTAGAGAVAGEADPEPYLVTLDSPLGAATLVAPPGRLDGEPLRWRFGPRPIGGDPPEWA